MATCCRTQVATVQPAENEFEPKYVVIITYQRCGSSFFGNIFNLNPNAFYSYEPLDSLYSSLYGTTFGWNVPSDITNNANGSARCDKRSFYTIYHSKNSSKLVFRYVYFK